MKTYQVYVDHETIIYQVEANSINEAQEEAIRQDLLKDSIEICSTEAVEEEE